MNKYNSAFQILFYTLLIVIICQSDLKCQVNYDESKIGPYDVPDLLLSEDGAEIANARDWEEKQRSILLKRLEHHVYGKFPSKGIQVDFKVRSVHNLLHINAIQKNIDVIFSNGTEKVVVDLVIFLPAKPSGPVPLFVGLNFYGNHTTHPSLYISVTDSWTMNKIEFDIHDNSVSETSRGVRANRWPVERILSRGYGLATMYYGDIDPDFDDGFKNGIHSLLSDESKTIAEGISSISAWAYGLSKALDYFELDKDIDHKSAIVIGHSRLGKAALWAGAIDQRFAITVSNNSGCGGAALSRRKFGETVKVINTSFPHWFSKNYKSVNDRELEQSFDQHTLLSLIAPRPIYVASAVKDKWADPFGEYLSLYHAAKVYKLYNDNVFASSTLPPLNEPLLKDKMAYHVRSGVHDITRFDWERYMDFADKVLFR